MPAEQAAQFGIAVYSSFAERLANAGPELYARAMTQLTEHLLPFERDGVVQMKARVHLVR